MKYHYRLHAHQRMFEREIPPEEVEACIGSDEVIETYPEDTPCPSFLKLHHSDRGVLHVVYAECEEDERIVITAYRPDPEKWDKGFRKRRRS